MRKLLLGLGTIAVIGLPVACVVSCDKEAAEKLHRPYGTRNDAIRLGFNHSDLKLNILTGINDGYVMFTKGYRTDRLDGDYVSVLYSANKSDNTDSGVVTSGAVTAVIVSSAAE